MAHKHLHELLKEDQEPFHLKTFIADRRSRLKSTTTDVGKTTLNVRKRKPIVESTSSPATARNFCINHVCMFSIHDSPEFRNSPFIDFPARELKSPCNNNAAVLLRIPAVLLDAAARVQKPKPDSKLIGFGLLGSLLRRLKDRSNRSKTREIGPPANATITPSVTQSSSPARRSRKNRENDGCEDKRLSHCSNDSIGVWSEKSSELETSCSSRSVHEFEEIECFCSNPSSPFRFSLQRTPSPTRRQPDSSSPVASPIGRFEQDEESYEIECQQEINRQKDEEKEQSSPVSVLDPLFDDGHEEKEHDGGAREEDYNIECSYASVQRSKHELLQKLQRFERLAGLDPIKLENHMLEQCYNEDVLVNGQELTEDELCEEIANHSGIEKIPWHMKNLVLDLIEEENKDKERLVIVQRVCKRLHSWKMVQSNTIDMMVETDFRSEGWTRCDKETIRRIEMDIEAAVFGFLVEELTQELVNYSSNEIFVK